MPLYVALHLLLFSWQALLHLSRKANIFSHKFVLLVGGGTSKQDNLFSASVPLTRINSWNKVIPLALLFQQSRKGSKDTGEHLARSLTIPVTQLVNEVLSKLRTYPDSTSPISHPVGNPACMTRNICCHSTPGRQNLHKNLSYAVNNSVYLPLLRYWLLLNNYEGICTKDKNVTLLLIQIPAYPPFYDNSDSLSKNAFYSH